MTKLRRAIGIDMGGTSVKLAVVNEKGQIEARANVPTAQVATPSVWLDYVAAQVPVMMREVGLEVADLDGVGIGVPGFVDFHNGFIYDLPNVPGWRDVKLGHAVEERLRCNVYVDNDVNVMAQGECAFGSGLHYKHAVFLTMGTGVGGGLLLDGHLYRGAYSMAGEIGHISIDSRGVKTPQGIGEVERYIGNQQIVDRAAQALHAGRASLLTQLTVGDFAQLTPKLIAEAAASGDALSLEIFDYVADCLACVLSSVTYMIQPQVFIIGGGVAQSGAVLFNPLQKHLKERLSPVFFERIEIKPASLGNDAGVMGGAALVMFP